jgi:hypothetical protein
MTSIGDADGDDPQPRKGINDGLSTDLSTWGGCNDDPTR